MIIAHWLPKNDSIWQWFILCHIYHSVRIQNKQLLLSFVVVVLFCFVFPRHCFYFEWHYFTRQTSKQTQNGNWCTKLCLWQFTFFDQFIIFQIHLKKYNNSFKYSAFDLQYIINIMEIIEGMWKRGFRNKKYQILDQIFFFSLY